MMSSSKLEKEILQSEYWGEGTNMMFRDLSVLVPANYDAYLKALFGDNYSEYEPSEEERTKTHFKKENAFFSLVKILTKKDGRFLLSRPPPFLFFLSFPLLCLLA